MSKNILLWSGHSNPKWGVNYWKNNGIGGSEYSLLKLAYYLKNKGHNITVGGDVEPSNQDGICWGTIDKKHYDIVIAINYIHFYQHLLDNNINFDEAYFWMHNEDYFTWYNGKELENFKWVFKQPKLKKIIGVSKTHMDRYTVIPNSDEEKDDREDIKTVKELFNYTQEEAKTYIDYIDNAIDLEDYKEIKDVDKIPGRIIWTSSPDRGLMNIIENWESWKLRRPDLSLVICSPPYSKDWFNKNLIENLKDIKWLGSLNPLSLKTEIAKAEYWIYLSDYFETYCISALEMMMGKVKIITTAPGNILNLIDEGRGELLKTPYKFRRSSKEAIEVLEKDLRTNYLDANVLKAYKWAQTQNWKNRINEWCDLLKLPNIDLAFYTCFYGDNNNEAFAIPEIPSLKHNCFYYTNNKDMIERLKDTKWIAVYDDKPLSSDETKSCMEGKHVKTMPHLYKELKDYSYTCFLDSKLDKVNDKFVEELIQEYFIDKNYAILLRKHWFVNDIKEEFEESMLQPRYVAQKDQYLKYLHKQTQKGYNYGVGLKEHCACGFLVRNMKHKKVKNINETWYKHIQECGIQDQISFNIVKQQFKNYWYPFTEIPFN